MVGTDLKKLTAKERALVLANTAQAKKTGAGLLVSTGSVSTNTADSGSTESAKERALSIAVDVQKKEGAGD